MRTGLLVLACTLAIVAALVFEAAAQTSPDPEPKPAASAEPTAQPTAEPVAGPAAPKAHDHGLEPLHGGKMVPLKWMPPGTHASPVPSEEIFPPQTITIRFNHQLHVKKFKQSCKICHKAAYESTQASDRLLGRLPDKKKPRPTGAWAADTCDNCHDVDHSNLKRVTAGKEDNGQCAFCHLGQDPGKGGRVARLVIPTPNLRMNHKVHLDRNIQCSQCHGMVENLELATRDQMPRMAGCFTCHAKSGAAQGDAKGACTGCHLTEPSGRMLTHFSTGDLTPPRWLHGSAHTPDWIERHKAVAGGNSEMCGSCHRESYCTDCHDGKVRPRRVHPNDWISMHAQAGRQDNPRCVSCHQLTTFCGDCHRRIGVARDTPSSNRLAGRRFHPSPQIWTTGPRSPQHHAFEAQRNLNACVSCHTERDCATCHATKGIRGGAGVNPHPLGFTSKCGLAMRRNPRPCLVCHSSSDGSLSQCQ